jgi:hypothetical protein
MSISHGKGLEEKVLKLNFQYWGFAMQKSVGLDGPSGIKFENI